MPKKILAAVFLALFAAGCRQEGTPTSHTRERVQEDPVNSPAREKGEKAPASRGK